MEPEAFDKGFREYVRDERIAHLRMVPLVSPDRTDELYFKYEDGEASTDDLVQLALAYTQQGSRFDAETFLGLARRAGADSSSAAPSALLRRPLREAEDTIRRSGRLRSSSPTTSACGWARGAWPRPPRHERG